MFTPLMVNTWVAATVVAVVAGVVGYFTVLRGSAFVAHAVPQSAFAGAAAASLLGVSSLLGLGVFSVLGALGIGLLGRRGRHDVATALAVVMMLGLGSLFLSFTTEYAPEIYSLLFGEILGVSRGQLVPIALVGLACIAALGVVYRPLTLSSVVPEVGEAAGVGATRMELCFLVVVALATATAVPVVGALLIFSLLIGPPAAARSFTARPSAAIGLGVVLAVVVVWVSIAASYLTNLPVGFFVGGLGAVSYGVGRAWAAWRRHRPPGASQAAQASIRGMGSPLRSRTSLSRNDSTKATRAAGTAHR
jgi:zinc/manganese transport system permease protein